MDRVAVDPDLWRRLFTCASGLPRTVQASLDKLSLFMSSSGSVRHALARLMLITARSRSTVSDHLGSAQGSGWLTCVQRGGYRPQGAQPSTYQATVPLHVWERRTEILAMFTEQDQDQTELPVFPLGAVIADQGTDGASSKFSPTKINPSLIIEGTAGKAPSRESASGSEGPCETDPVIAAVIEELAAHTGEIVSPAWAARCVSQIMRHRTVRHPIAYVVKSLQNAAQDGTLAERFMPNEPERTPRDTGKYAGSPEVPDAQPNPRARELLGNAPWDTAEPEAEDDQEAPDMSWEPVSSKQTGASAAPSLAEPVEIVRSEEPHQEIYRPGGRVLAGLGRTGALELVKLREQFAQRREALRADRSTVSESDALAACA